MNHESENRFSNRTFAVLAGFAALSLVVGIGLMTWGLGKDNQIAAMVGVLLLVDAGIVFLVAWRFR